EARKIIMREFENYFSYSDLDFYICIKNNTDPEILKNMDNIANDCSAMSYYILYYARIFIMMNKDIFNFCNYNNQYLSKEYDKLLTEINDGVKDNFNKDIKFIGMGFGNNFYIKNNEITIDKIMEMYINN